MRHWAVQVGERCGLCGGSGLCYEPHCTDDCERCGGSGRLAPGGDKSAPGGG